MVESNRNTKQKEIILKIVKDSCDHPTAEVVYERAKVCLPNISLGTVYRNLNQLSDLKAIRRVVNPRGSDHFDKTLHEHLHFSCSICGEVSDLETAYADIADKIQSSSEYQINDVTIFCSGVCNKCLERRKNESINKN